MDLFADGNWIALVFAALMGLSMLAYVVLDGYDLGVGMLMLGASDDEKDIMIASIGPFWDANETWLVLGVGILLVAFPAAHGVILTGLYIPVAIMLGGLILRGVAFDFRAKAKDRHKHTWNRVFFAGSLVATLAQGYMLAAYIVGFETNWFTILFGLLAGLGLAAGYSLLGACWLILKTEGDLQRRAICWAKLALWGTAAGMTLISLATPMMSQRIFEKWFSLPEFFLLLPIPAITGAIILGMHVLLSHLPRPEDHLSWLPLICTISLFVLGFHGLAYSFYPYIVPDQLTIWESASAPESLMIILVGTLFVLPFIVFYTVYAHRVFWGKAQGLSYY
jgi:cytochrome d ubiquinol oxidase subunit II